MISVASFSRLCNCSSRNASRGDAGSRQKNAAVSWRQSITLAPQDSLPRRTVQPWARPFKAAYFNKINLLRYANDLRLQDAMQTGPSDEMGDFCTKSKSGLVNHGGASAPFGPVVTSHHIDFRPDARAAPRGAHQRTTHGPIWHRRLQWSSDHHQWHLLQSRARLRHRCPKRHRLRAIG